ncbi:hypothetical protein A2U01_0104459, partial [Trifolium medium]|nr:hypothetical protein [Trifolium medium]
RDHMRPCGMEVLIEEDAEREGSIASDRPGHRK